MHRAAIAVRGALELPVELGHHFVGVRTVCKCVAVRPVGRGDHVALLQRAADADRAGLLPDRDMEEAGQLSGTEPLLDLLLEAPNEQHLPEEVAEEILRHSAFLLYLGHLEFEFMLRLVSLVEEWRKLVRELP